MILCKYTGASHLKKLCGLQITCTAKIKIKSLLIYKVGQGSGTCPTLPGRRAVFYTCLNFYWVEAKRPETRPIGSCMTSKGVVGVYK